MTKRRYLMVLNSLIPTCVLAQQLSAEDRACVNTAIDKLPPLDGLRAEGSRVLMSNPENGARNKLHPYTATVEIDVRVAGAKTTHSSFCHGDTITMKALPIEVR
jgi:hypothetical protein